MHALVTGGSGFIGSWLSEYLLKTGYKVTVIDNLSTGKGKNTSHLRAHPRFRFIEADYQNPAYYKDILRQCDALYHLASPVGVRLIVNTKNVDRMVRNHLTSTRQLYEWAAKYDIHVFFASSSEVYGKRLDVYPDERSEGLKEDKNGVWGAVDQTRWWYAHLKKCSEDLLLEYTEKKKLKGTIGRFFNVTGIRQSADYGMVVPRFIRRASAGLPLTVYGDGDQVRSFCSVHDAVIAMVQLMKHIEHTNSNVYNIGRAEPVTIIELARKVNAMLENHAGIKKMPLKKVFDASFEEIYYRIPNTQKLGNVLGTKLETSLDEIIEELGTRYHKEPEKEKIYSR